MTETALATALNVSYMAAQISIFSIVVGVALILTGIGYGGTMFRGLPTLAGKRFAVEHIHIYRLSDGQIAEHWVVRDDLGMMQQIGAISAAGE